MHRCFFLSFILKCLPFLTLAVLNFTHAICFWEFILKLFSRLAFYIIRHYICVTVKTGGCMVHANQNPERKITSGQMSGSNFLSPYKTDLGEAVDIKIPKGRNAVWISRLCCLSIRGLLERNWLSGTISSALEIVDYCCAVGFLKDKVKRVANDSKAIPFSSTPLFCESFKFISFLKYV